MFHSIYVTNLTEHELQRLIMTYYRNICYTQSNFGVNA